MEVKFKNWNCIAVGGYYGNANKAIQLFDQEDFFPVAKATVNLVEEKIDPDIVFIKDYSENVGMKQALINAGIINPKPVHTANTRFETVLGFRLTKKALEKLWSRE